MQFSKSRLTEFGELPFGEIPEALKVSRPTGYRSLENGVKVVSESWNSPITSYGCLINSESLCSLGQEAAMRHWKIAQSPPSCPD